MYGPMSGSKGIVTQLNESPVRIDEPLRATQTQEQVARMEKELARLNEQQKSFEEAARPLIKWLCENVHPHHSAIVTPTNAELLEGSFSTGQILDYVCD